ncbi:DUF1707 domain-containing protein [Candidatus Mycobacterium wuenschmannii]|uniref:DUF1707 domain-containing protein n=1 Tax=Candidatus Mycobacterium wuenschmannii TaxID=3027808 RepID=A0ABY8VSU7_9MYCO|nr:DUF1707 domain-containing protein [Candidatus Mycobacterium wuenschmannii]WIM86704.1 DUF1707 domain-containing protein [Candidatus Mycobacterium wuenschmannii]
MAKWLAAPGARGATAGTRARDSDRQDACRLLDDALNSGELSMEEHRERVKAATNAVTLGDLRKLVDDLQSDGGASSALQSRETPVGLLGYVRARIRRAGLPALVVALLAGLVFGIGIGWGIYSDSSSPFTVSSDPGARPDGVAPVVLKPPTQLHSVGGLTGLIEQARKRFGNVIGYRLLVYPTYASIDRPDPSDDRRILDSDYRGGWDDPTNKAKSGIDSPDPVDLSAFDIPTVIGILRGAPDTLHIKQAEVKNTYLIIEPAPRPVTPGALQLSVHVSSDFGSGSLTFAGDGTIKRVDLP